MTGFRIFPLSWLMLVLLLLPVLMSSLSIEAMADIFNEDEDVVVDKVTVVTGSRAELPCDISSPPLDSLYLVLWYKNDSDFPIFKYDARSAITNYRSSMDEKRTGGGVRIHLQFNRHPALLLVSNVVAADEGVYRCRVDFGKSPTRNVHVRLDVVVPPNKMRIIENNREVSSVIGPYDEGSSMSLNCIVTGGRPRPEVTWWMEDVMVDDTWISTSESVVQNVLILARLERHHLHSRLRCQARNINATETYAATSNLLVSSVQIDLNLIPLTVSISGTTKWLSAGQPYDLSCRAGGSRPAASIHWYLHSVLQPAKEKVTLDGNVTTSVLQFTPTARDHHAEIICRAFNPILANISRLETRKKLIVHYAPSAELELGRNLDADAIVEGNDVYFECRIRSNPSPTRVTWTLEDKVIKENASAGVLIVERGLVIRRVSRHQSGRYSCTAFNSEGHSVSNIVYLKVMYAPVCRPGQKTMHGVAKRENTTVHCQTDAVPRATSYRWAFNTSNSEFTQLNQHHPVQLSNLENIHQEQEGSVIRYSPQHDRDYGSLICWATNEIGEQRDPCVYRVFQGVRPDPPVNCTVVNQTADSVEVWCRPGFDGGHSQQFQFEIFDTELAVLLYNKSGRYPHLRVSNLESGLKLFIQISAFNFRGRSAVVPLEGYTIKIAEKQTVIMEPTDLASFLGIASGVLVTLVMICIGVGLTARSRNGQPSNGAAADVKKKVNAAAAAADNDDGNDDQLQHHQDHEQDRFDKEDDNPDLIPDSMGGGDGSSICSDASTVNRPISTPPMSYGRSQQAINGGLREALHPWPEEPQRYYTRDNAEESPKAWNTNYYPTMGKDTIHSAVISDANALYYNSLPAGRSARGGRSWSKHRSPVEVITVKSQQGQLPETSI